MSTPTPPPPTTISQLFDQPVSNCTGGADNNIFNSFFDDVSNNSPADTRAAVAATTSSGVLNALGVVHGSKVHVYPFLLRYDKLGGLASSDDGKLFAFRGDVRDSKFLPKLVGVKNELFNQQSGYAMSSDTLEQHYITDGATALVEGVDGTTVDAEKVTTRYCTVVPTLYVKYFLAFPEGMPVSHFWKVVYPLMKVDPLLPTFSGFIKYMRLAASAQAGDATSSMVAAEKLVPADTSDKVEDRAFRVLLQLLPDLKAAPASSGADTSKLAATVESFFDKKAAQREEDKKEQEEKEKQKKKDKLTNSIGPAVLRLCIVYHQVVNPEDLPDEFKQLITAKPAERLRLMVASAKESLQAAGEFELAEKMCVHPQTLKEDMELSWLMDTATLKGGGSMNPFNFTCGAMEQALAHYHEFMLINQGSHAALLDLREILDQSLSLPAHDTSIRVLKRQVAALKGLCEVDDKVVQYLSDHITAMEGMRYEWERYVTFDPKQAALKALYHLVFVALQIRQYVRRVFRGEHPVSVGDPYEICNEIARKRRWEPLLDALFGHSHQVNKLIKLSLGGRVIDTRDDATASTAGSSLTGSLSDGEGSDNTSGGADANQKKSGGHLFNSKFNAVLFQKYKTSATKSRLLRDRIEEKKLPELPKSRVDREPMCLAWHTKGECNEKCPRHPDHVEYTADQYQVKDGLVEWCGKNYEKKV